MCNQANADIMVDVVADLINDEKSFTAFDSTQEGMRRGTSERHSDLKGQVHGGMRNEVNAGTYERTLISTPTGDAWLYHPTGTDPSTYLDGKGWASTQPSSAQPSSRQPISQPVAAADDDDDDDVQDPAVSRRSAISGRSNRILDRLRTKSALAKVQNIDAEGRLPVYGDMLRQIGLGPTMIVEVGEHSGAVVLAAKVGYAERSYMVNGDGRIRLNGDLLERILGKPASSLTVTVNPSMQQIRVTL